MAYAAYKDGRIVGLCQFSINADCAMLVDLANASDIKDEQTLFITARAALNFVDLCGVRFSKCESKNIDDTLLRSIGFSKNSDGIYEIDLTHFF